MITAANTWNSILLLCLLITKSGPWLSYGGNSELRNAFQVYFETRYRPTKIYLLGCAGRSYGCRFISSVLSTLIENISLPLCASLLWFCQILVHTPSTGSHLFFVPIWESKNSTTSGQFSRKCFCFRFCRQLEMLTDRLTAEAGGLGRRCFDHSRVSHEISFTLPLFYQSHSSPR